LYQDEFQEVFGHPNQDGREGALTPIEFALQGTDYKPVGAYRQFFGDNASNPCLGSRQNGFQIVMAKFSMLRNYT
jgi:hypothetical protein